MNNLMLFNKISKAFWKYRLMKYRGVAWILNVAMLQNGKIFRLHLWIMINKRNKRGQKRYIKFKNKVRLRR